MKELSASRTGLLEKLYSLLGSQVKSYYTHRNMGENSSVPAELAWELLESMAYTIGDWVPGEDVKAALAAGQERLALRREQAKRRLWLVMDTAPDWQPETRWDALRCLDSFLEHYDHRHLAHRIPAELFYPAPFPEPEEKGLQYAECYVNLLWIENQIMAAVEDTDAEKLWSLLSRNLDPVNQCEQMVIQLLGKAMVARSQGLILTGPERDALLTAVKNGKTKAALNAAVGLVCGRLKLGPDARQYVRQTAAQLYPRLELAARGGKLSGIFL